MAQAVEKRSSDIFLEFLEVAVHTVLYSRRLYPETIFVKRKFYGTVAHCSIHPEVNNYIKETLKGVQELLKKNEVKKVCVVFCNKDQLPVDKIVFDVMAMYTRLVVEDTYYIHTEESLRAALLKISYTCSSLKPLNEDSSFSIQIHTTETASLTLTDDVCKQENYPWIQAEQKSVDVVSSKIIPIRKIDTDYLQLDLYAIESCVKSNNKS